VLGGIWIGSLLIPTPKSSGGGGQEHHILDCKCECEHRSVGGHENVVG